MSDAERQGAPREAHVIVSTHTTRWLRRTLLGVLHQDRPADGVVVTCDNDHDDIRELVGQVARDLDRPITLARRAHHGVARPSQVRNNGVRALLESGDVAPDAHLLFLDGDCVPRHDHVSRHLKLAGQGDLVVGYVVFLTPEQTEAFDEHALGPGRTPVEVGADQLAALDKRERRYRRQKFIRGLGLGKRHKPKLASGHMSVSLAMYRKVNGFDEEYEGWGAEDDDFGRRVYAAGGRPVIAVRDVVVLHQHHPSRRRPAKWSAHSNASLFRQRRPARCGHGLATPVPQHEVEVVWFGPHQHESKVCLGHDG